MRVFVYGTLCDPDTASDVLDAFEYVAPATWPGEGPLRDRVRAFVAATVETRFRH